MIVYFLFFIALYEASHINWTTHSILPPEALECTHFKHSQEPHGKAMDSTRMLAYYSMNKFHEEIWKNSKFSGAGKTALVKAPKV